MSGDNTVTTLNGLFKEKYAPKVQDLIPDGALLQRDIAFASPEAQIGNQYHQPVVLSAEHGFTYAAAASGAFSVNNQINAVLSDAVVTGAQVLLQSTMDYESAARSASSAKAFEYSMDILVRNMLNSAGKRVELEHIYGALGYGLGNVTAISGTSTTRALTVSIPTWSAALWAGLEGAHLDIYDNDGAAGALDNAGTNMTVASTKLNSNADVIVTSVDIANRKINVSGNATDLGGVDTAAAAAGGCYLYFTGSKGNEWTGALPIATNTGTLFSVLGGTYSFFQGNLVSAGSAPLSIQKILDSLSGPVARGLDEKITFYMNPRTWTNVMSDLAALRRFDGAYSRGKGETGFERVVLYSQNGEIELVPHPLLWQGLAFGIPTKQFKRLGAVDLTFNLPGSDKEFFFNLTSAAGIALRCYTMQALFTHAVAKCVVINNITNS